MRIYPGPLLIVILLAAGCASTSPNGPGAYSPPALAAENEKPGGGVAHSDSGYYLYRRVGNSSKWDNGTPYPQADVQALLKVATTARRWDGFSHAAASTEQHAYAPDPAVGLASVGARTERIIRIIDVCQGNWLLWYQGRVVQASKEGHETLDRLFPENK